MREHCSEIRTLTADQSTAQVACTIHPDGRPVVTIIQIPGWFRTAGPLEELQDILETARCWLAEHSPGESVIITPAGDVVKLSDVDGDGA